MRSTLHAPDVLNNGVAVVRGRGAANRGDPAATDGPRLPPLDRESPKELADRGAEAPT